MVRQIRDAGEDAAQLLLRAIHQNSFVARQLEGPRCGGPEIAHRSSDDEDPFSNLMHRLGVNRYFTNATSCEARSSGIRNGPRTSSSAEAFSRSSKWSPTRRAFAMIVSVGFTAPLEMKKLPSTT